MSYKEFNKDLAENKIESICLLYGKEAFLSEWAENEIVKAYTNEASRQFDLVEFDGEGVDIYKIVEACETLPVFSKKRLVIVNRLPALEGKETGKGEEALRAYLKNPSDTTLLLFVCGEKIDKRRVLYKSIEKHGKIYSFDTLDRKELRLWIKKRFKTKKRTITEKNLEMLIDLSGYFDTDSEYTLSHFENDLSKIIIHSEGEEITADDIEKNISGNVGRNIFRLIDFIGEGNKRDAFSMLNDMLLFGENEFGIFALLYRQYENIFNVKQLLREGYGKNEIAKRLSTNGFIVNKWLTLSRRYSEEELKTILKKIYTSEKYIKTGEMSNRMALELLIASI